MIYHYISNIQPEKAALKRVTDAIHSLPLQYQNWFMIHKHAMPDTFDGVYNYVAALEAGMWSVACFMQTPREIFEQFNKAWLGSIKFDLSENSNDF